MTGAALVADLRRRGVRVVADGNRLRCAAPRGTLSAADVEELRVRKAEVLEALSAEAISSPIDGRVMELRERIGGVMLATSAYGEVWIALDAATRVALVTEEAERPEPRPVLLADDVVRLRGKAPESVRTALNVIAVFPDARLIQ